MKTTYTIEKYEIQIGSLMRQIAEVKKTLEKRDGIRGFSAKNPEKIEQAVQKLIESQRNLWDAIGLLLDSGNLSKTGRLKR